MLYYFLFSFHTTYSGFNVFRYITFRAAIAALMALMVSFLFGPYLIRSLAARQIGQSIRDDGPATHSVKAGTPTMGGTLIILAFFLSTLANHSLGPIITTVAILIGCTIISTFEVGMFRTVQPFLFTTYLSKWQGFFAFEVQGEDMGLAIAILVGHMAIFFGGAAGVFLRKDCTT